MLALAACGGDGEAERRTVTGTGYAFEAPAGVEVTRSGRTLAGEVGGDVVSVTVFRLAQRYQPALWELAVPELDRVAAALARKLGGEVTRSETRTIGGRRARVHRIEGARDDTRLVAFVLRGPSEYQLLCRWPDDRSASEACDDLLATFRLA